MLYPKKYTRKDDKKYYEIIIFLKNSIFSLIKAFSSYHAFALFIQQKFHF